VTAAPALEHPEPPWVELHVRQPLTPQERLTLAAANATATPEVAWHEALMAYRLAVITRARQELLKKTVIDEAVIRRTLDLAWQAFFPMLHRATGPMIAEAYIRAFRDAKSGNVPIQMIYGLAEEHARRVGGYFHETSTDALIQGFNTHVNRRVPQKAALERVLDAYGLTPRQMSGMTSAKFFDDKVESSLPRALKNRVQSYIGKSIRERLKVFTRQEAHNLNEQAQQVAWLWLVEQGHLPQSAQKMWLTAKDERVCGVCGPLHQMKVSVKDQFILDDGQRLYVPGAHVNCRCEVRLVVNPFESVGKRFDPHQPRNKDGRWVSGTSKYRTLGNKLNAMDTVEAELPSGTTSRFVRQVGRYTTEPRYVLTPLKEKDRELLRLSRGAMIWSQSGRGVDRVRNFTEEQQNYYGKKMKLRGADKGIQQLRRAVESAPANSPQLYRGMNVSVDHLSELKPGGTFELPISSFSTDRGLSEAFARKWGPMIAQNRAKREGSKYVEGQPVMMVLEEKSKALNISPLVAERNAEWVTQGKFTITDVVDDDGLTIVYLTQRSPVRKDLEGNELQEFNQEHPRDQRGRFARKREAQARPVREREVAPEVEEMLRRAREARIEEAVPETRLAPPSELLQERIAPREETRLAPPTESRLAPPAEQRLTPPPEEAPREKGLAAPAPTRGLAAPQLAGLAAPLTSRISAPAMAGMAADVEHLAALEDERLAAEQRRRRITEKFRETVRFVDANGDPHSTYTIMDWDQVTPEEERVLVTYENPLRIMTDEERRTGLFTKALEKHDASVNRIVNRIMGGTRRDSIIVHKLDPVHGQIHTYVDRPTVFQAVLSTTSEKGRDNYVPLTWYNESAEAVIPTEEFPELYEQLVEVDPHENEEEFEVPWQLKDLAKALDFKPEELEVVVVVMREGYENAYLESGTKVGEEVWRAPGNYKIVGERREKLHYLDDIRGEATVPVRFISAMPENVRETEMTRDLPYDQY
jgi:hypothetical protein